MAEEFHKIHPDLIHLKRPIDSLKPLENNPRKGDTEAMMAMLDTFGQVRPINVRDDDDGTTIMAGNTTWRAAKRLGWTHMAASALDGDQKHAIAFALGENRSHEVGHTDPNMEADLIFSMDLVDTHVEVLDALGWDDFELAAMEESMNAASIAEHADPTYIPPQVQHPGEPYTPPEADVAPVSRQGEDGETRLEAPEGTDTASVVTQGATASGAAGSSAIARYDLVFDSPEQQRRWFAFTRWLRADPGTEGETIAERLMDFLEAHADF